MSNTKIIPTDHKMSWHINLRTGVVAVSLLHSASFRGGDVNLYVGVQSVYVG